MSVLSGCILLTANAVYGADVVVVDILGPQIEHTNHSEAITRDQMSSAILAKVSDDFGVFSVNLFYRLAGSQKFQSLVMRRNAASGAYFAPLKMTSLPEGEAAVEYYFEAVDVNDNKSIKMDRSGQLYRLMIAKTEKLKKKEKIQKDLCRYNFSCDD